LDTGRVAGQTLHFPPLFFVSNYLYFVSVNRSIKTNLYSAIMSQVNERRVVADTRQTVHARLL